MSVRFAIASPGAVLPPPAAVPQPKRLAPLGAFLKAFTSPGAYEIVKARTADSEWLFELHKDGWRTGHLPTETVVRCRLRSLEACRAYVASGQALADLDRLQAHERGEHETERDKLCPRCRPAQGKQREGENR